MDTHCFPVLPGDSTLHWVFVSPLQARDRQPWTPAPACSSNEGFGSRFVAGPESCASAGHDAAIEARTNPMLRCFVINVGEKGFYLVFGGG
jgi:hypothetical protein